MKLLLVTLLATASIVGAASAGNGTNLDQMSYSQLAREANKVIRNGGIYGDGHGEVSNYLKQICYEMIDRAFRPYGTQEWAAYVIRRESDCNPAAVNHTYSSWKEQANGLAQMIPRYHTWVNYDRVHRDMRYAVAVFVKLSRGGRSTGPWACGC